MFTIFGIFFAASFGFYEAKEIVLINSSMDILKNIQIVE